MIDSLKYYIIFLCLAAIIVAIFGINSCSPKLDGVDSRGNPLPMNIKKFKDGEITCWVYEDKGISCLKN